MMWRIGVAMLATAFMSGCGQQGGKVADGPADGKRHEVMRPAASLPEAERKSAETEPQKVMLGSPELLAGIPGEGPVTIAQLQAWLDTPANHIPLHIELPMWLKPGVGQIKDLKDNPLTRAKIELGRQLFFDKRLSADNTISCASCHEPEKGYTVSTSFAVGIGGAAGEAQSTHIT